MDTMKVYNHAGEISGEMKAPGFLAEPVNLALMHQIYKSAMANKRKSVAHTKDRSEVSGGGIKPWRQKGTGRARHGSIRSPLWRHGGVTFGPRNTTDYSQKMNKKMAREAVRSALAQKLADGKLYVVESLRDKELAKTKEVAKLLHAITNNKSTLFVVSESNRALTQATANIKNVRGATVSGLNAADILNHTYIVMEQSALDTLQK